MTYLNLLKRGYYANSIINLHICRAIISYSHWIKRERNICKIQFKDSQVKIFVQNISFCRITQWVYKLRWLINSLFYSTQTHFMKLYDTINILPSKMQHGSMLCTSLVWLIKYHFIWIIVTALLTHSINWDYASAQISYYTHAWSLQRYQKVIAI